MSAKDGKQAASASATDFREYVTFHIGGQLFGIGVLRVQDVLNHCRTARIPLAPPEIAGSLNLRGRIVTALDVRLRIGLPPREPGKSGMSIVVDHHGELYSLIVDTVGEVLPLDPATFERSPPTIDPRLRDYADGIFRLEKQLLVVLDVDRLLDFGQATAAA